MAEEIVPDEEIKKALDERERVESYKTTPAMLVDVHRISMATASGFFGDQVKPLLDDIAKVATVALILQDLIMRKGLATDDDFRESIKALENAGIIKNVS